MKPRIVFMGTPEFAAASLKALIAADFPVVAAICQPDRPVGRSGKPQPPPVKQVALATGIKVLQPESVKTPQFEKQLAECRPDLIVTAAYGRILPKNILDLPPLGCLNVHASLLPAYRGAAPIQWCLIHGETETGITLMLMDEGMDTGDILRQEKMALDDSIDAGTLTGKLADMGARMLPQAVEDHAKGRLEPRPQDDRQASLAPMLKKKDGLIDWDQSAKQVHDQIRGLHPWPGAFTYCDGKRLKVHRARVRQDPALAESARDLAPGTICLCGPESISVACRNGVVDLLEVQSASGRRMHCRDCAHNYRLGQKVGGTKP